MNKAGIALAALVLFAVAASYHLLFDGALPKTSSYEMDFEAVRQLADAPEEILPTEIRMETLARSPVPYIALRAGGGFHTAYMTRATFQIVTPYGYFVLESGMDRALAEEYDQADEFDESVWANIQKLLSGAAGVLVTHEHPDHIGGIVRHHTSAALAERMILTKEQFNSLPHFAPDDELPQAFEDYMPVELVGPRRIAPGIVMVRANGHTPGSVMFFVKLNNGAEYLFIGDIAYTGANVRDGVDRPRLVRYFMVSPEDRDAVINQLRTLNDLSKAHPALMIIPSHAEDVLSARIEDGSITVGFGTTQPDAALADR